MKRNRRVTRDKDNDFNYMTDERTGRILYCINFNFEQPEDDWHLTYGGELDDVTKNPEARSFSKDKKNKLSLAEMSRAFDYIAYHGYFGDTSIDIGGITGSEDKLYLTTQLALYYVMVGEAGGTPHIPDPAAEEVIEPATALYDEAIAYAKGSSQGPETGTAICYRSNEDGVQNVLTRRPVGRIRIRKVSTEPGISADDTGYSLQGAEFAIYTDENLTQEVETTFVYEDEVYVSSELPSGDYWIKETKAPKGFSVASGAITVHIAGGPQTAIVEEPPVYALVTKVLSKVDGETGSSQTTGAGILAGAQFTVSFFADATGALVAQNQGTLDAQNLPSKPTRAWTIETDQEGIASLDIAHLVSGDDLYTTENGTVGLPLGIIVVKETKAPAGYRLNTETWTTRITVTMAEKSLADNKPIMLVQDNVVQEEPIRADIAFDKVEQGTGRKMGDVLFRVTSQTTGESHVVMTDGDGHFSSRAFNHSNNTNQLDGVELRDGSYACKDGDSRCGTWFFGCEEHDDQKAIVDDDEGAFPYDTYTFQELPSDKTLGHSLISFEVTVDGTHDGKELNAGTKEDATVSLTTSATDVTDGDKYLAGTGSQIIKDTVSYRGLSEGSSYTLSCTLMDGDTGAALLDTYRNPYLANVSFTPQASDGSVDVTVKLDKLPDTSRIVVYERLLKDGMLLVSHEAIDDQEQTVWLPSIATTLVDTTDKDHSVPSDSICNLTDTVEYSGLIPGKSYELQGKLVDRTTGTELSTATAEFTTSESHGTSTVTFEVDTTGLAEHDIVAFETLSYRQQEVCEHRDLDDTQQTVSVIRNFATLPQTGARGLPMVASLGCVTAAVGGIGRFLRLRHHL